MVGFGHGLIFIIEVGKREAVPRGFFGHHFRCIIRMRRRIVGADGDRSQTERRVLLGKGVKRIPDMNHIRTVVADESDQ